MSSGKAAASIGSTTKATDEVSPLPQSMDTACVSWVPMSVNVPLIVTEPSSLMTALLTLRLVITAPHYDSYACRGSSDTAIVIGQGCRDDV